MAVFGLVLVVLGGVLGWQWRRVAAQHRRLYLTESVTPGELATLHAAAKQAAGPDAFRQTVDVAGAAQGGAAGMLTSPLTGTACVWHHHTVVRRERTHSTDAQGRRTESTVDVTESSATSEATFRLHDATASIEVALDVAVDHAEKVLDEFVPEARPGKVLGRQRTEWVLRVGTRLFVHADALDRGGVLMLARPEDAHDRMVITTRSQDEVLASGARSAKALLYAALAATVLGVVLIVVGLA